MSANEIRNYFVCAIFTYFWRSMVLLNKITTLQAFQVKIYAVPDFLCSQCTVKEEAKMCSQWSFLGFYWLIYAPKISDWSNCISQYLERVPVGQIAWHSTHNELLLVKCYVWERDMNFPDSKCFINEGFRTPMTGEAGLVPVQLL